MQRISYVQLDCLPCVLDLCIKNWLKVTAKRNITVNEISHGIKNNKNLVTFVQKCSRLAGTGSRLDTRSLILFYHLNHCIISRIRF